MQKNIKNLLTNAILFDIIVERLRKVSSVGRASALQAEGHRFEPCTFHQRKKDARGSHKTKAARSRSDIENSSGGRVFLANDRARSSRENRALYFPPKDFYVHKNTRNGLVAQLVRALACHARGRGFEPHPSRHFS